MVKRLVNSFDVNPGVNGTHVGIIQFDNEPTLLLSFEDLQTPENVDDKINTYRIRRGSTYLNKAIDMADVDLFDRDKKMRGPEYQRVGMLHCLFF